MMQSNVLQRDFTFSKAFRISWFGVCAQVGMFVLVFLCTHTHTHIQLHVVGMCVGFINSAPTFTIPQDFTEYQSSPTYLILQELTVQVPYSAAANWLIDKSQNVWKTEPLIWVMLVQVEQTYSNAELSAIYCADFGLLCAKKYLFSNIIWHSVLCLLQKLCHLTPI